MDDDPTNCPRSKLSEPVVESFQPLVSFLYFGSFAYFLLAVWSGMGITHYGMHSRPDLGIQFLERSFWSICCFGLARLARWVVETERAAQKPVNPPDSNPDSRSDSNSPTTPTR